jgi:Lar family restriction alleviation protein
MSLLPCPFCGSDAVHISAGFVVCTNCDADGPYVEDPDGDQEANDQEATEKWNTRATPGWVSCADRMPDPMTWVLVSDGENVREDRWYPWQEINGRGLLPSDQRRDPSKAKPKWETYENVTHWMSLPSAPCQAPNAELARPAGEPVPATGADGLGSSALFGADVQPEREP